MPDGKVSTKCDKDAYHVRDIEKYYEEFKDSVGRSLPKASEVDPLLSSSGRRATLRSSGGSIGRCTSDEASESGFAFHVWGSLTTFL